MTHTVFPIAQKCQAAPCCTPAQQGRATPCKDAPTAATLHYNRFPQDRAAQHAARCQCVFPHFIYVARLLNIIAKRTRDLQSAIHYSGGQGGLQCTGGDQQPKVFSPL